LSNPVVRRTNINLRWLCALGYYMPASGDLGASEATADFTDCEHNPCLAGYVSTTRIATEATCGGVRCPSGQYCEAASSEGVLCPPGTSNQFRGARERDECRPCFPGSFNDAWGSSKCTSCESGSYTAEYGATSCDACPAGGYCPSPTGSLELVFKPCPAGSFNPFAGQAAAEACLECPAGSHNPRNGQSSSSACQQCRPGYMAPADGMAECTPCPAGSFVDTTNATVCKPCLPGHYCAEGSAQPAPCKAGTYDASLPGVRAEASGADKDEYAGLEAPSIALHAWVKRLCRGRTLASMRA